MIHSNPYILRHWGSSLQLAVFRGVISDTKHNTHPWEKALESGCLFLNLCIHPRNSCVTHTMAFIGHPEQMNQLGQTWGDWNNRSGPNPGLILLPHTSLLEIPENPEKGTVPPVFLWWSFFFSLWTFQETHQWVSPLAASFLNKMNMRLT